MQCSYQQLGKDSPKLRDCQKQSQRDTAEKVFEISLNRFGSGMQGHLAMTRFEKRRQREDETIDKFLDNLQMLRRCS